MKNKAIINIDTKGLTQKEVSVFMENIKNVTVSYNNSKPLTIYEMILDNVDKEQIVDKLTIERMKELIIMYAPKVFSNYKVTIDGSIILFDGVVVFNLNNYDGHKFIERYLTVLQPQYEKLSNYEFVKANTTMFLTNPLTFELKVKPKNLLYRWLFR